MPFYSITITGDTKRRTVHFTSPRHPHYVVAVTVNRESVVTSITVSGTGVSPRDLKRLPLATYAEAAVLVAWRRGKRAHERAWERIQAPEGRPPRDGGTEFYQELAETYRALVRSGERFPAKEIARRKRVSPNTVHQWLFRSRDLGFLERRARRKK